MDPAARALLTSSGMLYILLPFLVLVVGLLLWALAANPIVKESGRYLFVIGAAVTVWLSAHAVVHLP